MGDGEEPSDGSIILLLLDQNIPNWLIEIMFLEEVETAVIPGVKYKFGITAF